MALYHFSDGPPLIQGKARLKFEQDAIVSFLSRHKLKHKDCHVVSLLGATHAGKSFLINKLLQTTGFSGSKEAFALEADEEEDDEGNMRPTTSGASIFHCRFPPTKAEPEDAKPRDIVLIDWEGSFASVCKIPTEEDQAAPSGADSSKWTEKLLMERSRSADELIPRIAYLISDVVVWISETDLANRSFFDETKKFAEKCKRDGCEMPSLVLGAY